MMTKIGVDLRLLYDPSRTGLGRYALNLFNELKLFAGEEYLAVGEIDETLSRDVNFVSYNYDLPQNNNAYANRLLTLVGYMSELDLVHSLYFPIPEKRTFKGILTIHDLIPVRMKEIYGNQIKYDFCDVELRKSIKYVDHIIAISEKTKADIIDFYSINPEMVTVIYEGVDPVFTQSSQRNESNVILDKFNISGKYLLSVCTIEPRKNLSRLLEAYTLFRNKTKECIKLVLTGKLGWRYDTLLESIHRSKFADDIILTGYVSDKELACFYQNALAFIFPSLMEGFGLPVLEAMACGSAVITSNCSSLPEIGGDGAVYCDPYDVESIFHAIDTLTNGKSLNEEIRVRGLERAKLFSWKKAAAETRQVYMNCL